MKLQLLQARVQRGQSLVVPDYHAVTPHATLTRPSIKSIIEPQPWQISVTANCSFYSERRGFQFNVTITAAEAVVDKTAFYNGSRFSP
jgi:hypothetical protein